MYFNVQIQNTNVNESTTSLLNPSTKNNSLAKVISLYFQSDELQLIVLALSRRILSTCPITVVGSINTSSTTASSSFLFIEADFNALKIFEH